MDSKLLRVGTVLLLTCAVRDASAQVSVCDRTIQVQDAIVAAAGGANCAQLEPREMREITSLDLSSQSIAALRAGDFDGLVRLESLDLSDNLLTVLPQGIFDELYLLKFLYLDGNLLSTLRADVFDQLFLLRELTLDDNRFTSLPSGMFEEFSRFDGIEADGDPPDNSGDYPRIQRFLDRHRVASPEEFIAALPDLYKERFVMMYESEAAAKPHVSSEHPRITSWGADGNFIFAWNTDPDAPSQFRDSVEFMRQDDTAWTAGVIDFSGATPEITEPAACMACHGSLNKPLWGLWGKWFGSEYDLTLPREQLMEDMIESDDPRIEPLAFPAAAFRGGYKGTRFMVTPHGKPVVAAVEEAGAVWSWRHVEVLFRILRERHEDFRPWGEDVMCVGSDLEAQLLPTVRSFDQREHNLILPANADVVINNGLIDGASFPAFGDGVSDFLRYNYYYHPEGSVGDALVFLTIVELWQAEPIVRHLYRKTPNGDTIVFGIHAAFRRAMLHFERGSATAEDELIQKLRLHFGRGGRAALDLRGRQNDRFSIGGVYSASFWNGHAERMRPMVCRALTESAPKSLRVLLEDGRPILSWDAPSYDIGSVTGYRILRGVDGAGPTMHIENTGSTNTTWSDEDSPIGDVTYVVKTVYDGYYASPESNEAETAVVADGGAVFALAGSGVFEVLEGDTAVAMLTATGSGAPDTDLVWGISGGADQSSFSLTSGGELTFAAAKDFEAPDDTDGDGAYNLTVTVSDDVNSSSADLSVMLSNRNEAPTADAGADQGNVAEGAMVTLGGQGEDPDAGDTLTYEWTQTGSPSVDLANPLEATTTFVAPAGLTQDATLLFTLRVTDGRGLYSSDDLAVTVLASEEPLTAWVSGLPASHDGASNFSFELHFSHEADTTPRELRHEVFRATGGSIARARKLVTGSKLGWRIVVTPDSTADVELALDGGRGCDAAGAICTVDGVRLSEGLALTVPGPVEPELTAWVSGLPVSHGGSSFMFELHFSEEIQISFRTLRDQSFEVTGGTVARARRLAQGSDLGWQIHVTPTSNADTVLVLAADRPCDSAGAICTAVGGRLQNRLEITVPGLQ